MKNTISKKHKTIFIIVSVLLVSAIFFGVLFSFMRVKIVEPSEVGYEHYDVIVQDGQTVAFSKAMAFTSTSLSGAKSRGADGVHVTLYATVYPEHAENQNVSWEVRWADNAPLKNTPVEDYLEGTADENNGHIYNATCKQAFLNNKILITVTTEEGGFSDTCTVSFIGLAENLTVSGSSATLNYTDKRGEYYALNKGTSYTFNIGATNSWGVVGATDYRVSLSANGELYFGDEMTDENGYSTWRNVTLVNIADRIDDYATVSMNGNVLTITMGDYYIEDNASQYWYKTANGRVEWDELHLYFYVLDNFYDNGTFNWDTFEREYDERATENFENLESVCFTATVRDMLSGISITIPFYFRVSVESVALNSSTVGIN